VGRHDARVVELPATLAGREAPPARHSWVGWVPVAALAAAALILVVLVIGAAVPTAPATAGLDAPLIRHPAPFPAETPTPAATTPEAAAGMQRELIDLADRLPTGLALTPPAGWARWAGGPPAWPRDVDGCPHISRLLGAALGGRWTYVYGTMPQDSCTWVPVPWNPRQPRDRRFSFAVGFRQGDVRPDPVTCGRNVPVATLRVPDVAPGAVLSGCQDAAGNRVRLALADPRRTGVWYLDATSGAEQREFAPATVLPALVEAARTRLG
jgi:hypothetical protein